MTALYRLCELAVSPFAVVTHICVAVAGLAYGGKLCFICWSKIFFAALYANKSVTSQCHTQRNGVFCGLAVTFIVDIQRKQSVVKCVCPYFDVLLLHINRGHLTALQPIGVPFAPVAKAAYVDELNAMIAVIFLSHRLRQTLHCRDVYFVRPHRHTLNAFLTVEA